MSAKHTPAPWHVGLDQEHVGTSGISGPMVALTAPQDWQAVARGAGVPSFPQDEAERIANTRLIAAAPDLLELAKQYASECGECDGRGEIVVNGGPNHDAQYQPEPCPDCADIRAVIAKAEA